MKTTHRLLTITIILALSIPGVLSAKMFRCKPKEPNFIFHDIVLEAPNQDAAKEKAIDRCCEKLLLAKASDNAMVDICTDLECK